MARITGLERFYRALGNRCKTRRKTTGNEKNQIRKLGFKLSLLELISF